MQHMQRGQISGWKTRALSGRFKQISPLLVSKNNHCCVYAGATIQSAKSNGFKEKKGHLS